MRRLILALKNDSSRGLPTDFREVVISRATGWHYWEIATQPLWFIERLMLYMQAENTVEKIKAKQFEMKGKSKLR